MRTRSETVGEGWRQAWELLQKFLMEQERVDALLESLPRNLGRLERARCQNLFFGTVRHLGRLESVYEPLLHRAPRTTVRAILLLAGYELIEAAADTDAAGRSARVVHYAVEQAKSLASPAEAKLVNAVVRRMALALNEQTPPGPQAGAAALAAYHSHPEWLVQRWLSQLGATATLALLEWNQRPATVHARWRLRDRLPTAAELAWLKPTPWPEFYEIIPGAWSEVEAALQAGTLFLQDPATRMAVELVAPQAGEVILDACASPGGKSLAMADRMGTGRLVALDLPGPRSERLAQNLAKAGAVEVALVLGDLVEVDAKGLLGEHRLPDTYDAVLLDAPCSNTGVMRHRVDVKWRLRETDFAQHARMQVELLMAAARRVRTGGRLVYSTCSVDTAENLGVVNAFLERQGGKFRLAEQRESLPWRDGHDGAAAFLLRG